MQVLVIFTQLKSKILDCHLRKLIIAAIDIFIEENLLMDLSVIISSDFKEYNIFESKFVTVLDIHAPQKTKIIRGNEKPHVNQGPS